MPAWVYLLLSDIILVIHFAFVAFILLGFVLIWAGYFFRWSFISNFRFRMAHIAAMGFVVAESIIGMVCPLTTWENQLRLRAGRGQAYKESFIEHWLGPILFFDVSERTFTIIYSAFFLFVVVTFVLIPPRRKQARP